MRSRLSIDENYLITAEQSVTNRGENAIALNPFWYVSAESATSTMSRRAKQDSWTIHIGPMGVFDGVLPISIPIMKMSMKPGAAGIAADATKWLDRFYRQILARRSDSRPAMRKSKPSFVRVAVTFTRPRLPAKMRKSIAPGKVLKTTTRLFAGCQGNRAARHL